MSSQSLRRKTFLLLATSALTLLFSFDPLSTNVAHASKEQFTREETAQIIALQKGQKSLINPDGKVYSPDAARDFVKSRRALSSGGSSGGLGSEEKAALEKKIEEAEKKQKQQEQLLRSQSQQAEEFQRQKELAEREQAKLEESRIALEQQIRMQQQEHEKTLRELEQKHFRLAESQKRKAAELEQELKLAAEAQEFRGFDYLNKRLSDVTKRIGMLERMVTPDQEDMQDFIDTSKKTLNNLNAEASAVSLETGKEILLDLQKKISVFSFNFEIGALDYLSRNAAKSGIELPDSFYDMTPEQQEEAINAAKGVINTKIKEAQETERKRAANEALLRGKLKIRAADEFELMKKEIGDVPYLKAEIGKSLAHELQKMEEYARADDYDRIDYAALQEREREIGTIAEQGKGADGSLIKSFLKKVTDIHDAQHPDNVTVEQIKFAEHLYFELPGIAKNMSAVVGGPGMPPPPPGGPNSAPPPPPPPGGPNSASSSSSSQAKEIPNTENFKALFELRLKSYTTQLPAMPALLNENPQELRKYQDLVIKKSVAKLKLFQDFVGKLTKEGDGDAAPVQVEGGRQDILVDIKKIMDGTIEPQKLYAYYLMLSALKSETKMGDIQLKWQKDDRSNLRTLRSFINYAKSNILDPEIEKELQKAQGASATKPKFGAQSEAKIDIFQHVGSFLELWKADPDLKKIAPGEQADKLSGTAGAFKPLSTAVDAFISKAYGIAAVGKVQDMLSKIPVDEGDSPEILFRKLKVAIATYIENIEVGGVKLETLKGKAPPPITSLIQPKNLGVEDYQGLMIILSHFLDDPKYMEDLLRLEHGVEGAHISSSTDLKQELTRLFESQLQEITRGRVFMDSISEEIKVADAASSNKKAFKIEHNVDRRFDIPGNIFTPQTINAKFESMERTLSEFSDEYRALYTKYTDGSTIFPPSAGLLAAINPQVSKIVSSLDKTEIEVNPKTIEFILDAIKDIEKKLNANKSFKATIDKLTDQYPKLLRLGKMEEAKNLVEESIDTIQLINMKDFIPPEKQGRNVSYTYLKTFITLSALGSTNWKVEAPSQSAPVSSSSSSSSGGHSQASSSGQSSSQASSSGGNINLSALTFEELKRHYAQLGEEIKAKDLARQSAPELRAESTKYSAEIEKREKPSMVTIWQTDRFGIEVYPNNKDIETIPLLRTVEDPLPEHDHHAIVEFMKAIKDAPKQKGLYGRNLNTIKKFAPHLVAEIEH